MTEDIIKSITKSGLLNKKDDGGYKIPEEIKEKKRKLKLGKIDIGRHYENGRERYRRDMYKYRKIINEYDIDMNVDKLAHLLLKLERAETSDLPNEFIHLNKKEIHKFAENNSEGVILFWQEDCRGSETVIGDLEKLIEEGDIPERFCIGTVECEDNLEYIRNEFQVGITPTLLFCRDGGIDSRLIGAKPTKILQREIEIVSQA